MTGALDIEEGGGQYVQPPQQPAPQQQAPQQQDPPPDGQAPQQQAPLPDQQPPVVDQQPQPDQQVVPQPVQDQQPAPPQAPHASTSWFMGADWTDAEQEKVRAARGKVLGGIAKLGSGLAGAATSAATYLKADATHDDPEADDQAKASGWLTFTGAVISVGFALTGLHDIYDGIRSWTAQIRAHEARLAGEAAQHPQVQQVLAAVDAAEQAAPQLQAVIHVLGEEQQNLQQQQDL